MMRLHHDENVAPTGGDGLWLALTAAGVPLCLVDSTTAIVWANTPFLDMFGSEPADAHGQPLLEVMGLESNEGLRTALSKVIHGTDALRQLELVTDEGSDTRHDLTISLSRTYFWDGASRAVLVVEDRTHLVQPLRSIIERKFDMARRASEGSLAGLPSRSTLEFLLASSLRRAVERHVPFALLFCDVEGLDEIGFHHGHGVVDEMRWIAAARMNRVLRLHDTLAHLGGDEFIVIAEEVGNLDVARLIANRLINSVGESLRVKDAATRLHLRVGITLPTGNENAYRLLAPGPRDEVIRSADVLGVG
jgi:diguanylate cyclase (GGDEF)-like protein